MKTIPLTQGQVAMVDDEDFERINQHKWHLLKSPYTFYAVRTTPRKEGRKMIYMHREILGLIDDDESTQLDTDDDVIFRKAREY